MNSSAGGRLAGLKSVPIVYATGKRPAWLYRRRGSRGVGDLAFVLQAQRGPGRTEPTFTQGEHEAPHGRQDAAPPRSLTPRRRALIHAIGEQRDHEYGHLVEVFGEVPGRLVDAVGLRTGRRLRRSFVAAAKFVR